MHAVTVAVGLGQLLLRSAIAFEVVKLAGALVLIVLGGRSLWTAWRVHGTQTTVEIADEPRRRTHFVQGLLTNLTNLTNPKATLLFMAALPQFVPADRPGQAIPVALGLAAIAVLFRLGGLGLTAIGVHRVRHLLRSRRVRRVPEALLGTTLVALGVRVATQSP